MKDIGISYSVNTKENLEEIIGEELDYYVLREVIDNSYSVWKKQKAKNTSEAYKYGTLKKIVSSDYIKAKYRIEVRKAEKQREKREWIDSVNYRKAMEHSAKVAEEARRKKEKEGVGDISLMLDELFEPIESEDECKPKRSSLEVIEQILNERIEDDIWGMPYKEYAANGENH